MLEATIIVRATGHTSFLTIGREYAVIQADTNLPLQVECETAWGLLGYCEIQREQYDVVLGTSFDLGAY